MRKVVDGFPATARELDEVRVSGASGLVTFFELFDVVGGYDPPKPSRVRLAAEAAANRWERAAKGKGRGAE